MFIGSNLQWVRKLNGYSRKELGDKVGVSEQAIWQFENQMISPSFETVIELKKIFSVRTSFFFKEKVNESYFSEEKIAYREADIVSKKKIMSEITYLDTVFPIIRDLEKLLTVPSPVIKKIREKSLAIYYNEEKSRAERIKEIARIAKSDLGVSLNNSNLLVSLEKSGIYIVEKNIGGKADAYSVWSDNGQIPFIVLGKRKSAVRRNFDLAHELGHLLMHFNLEFVTQEKRKYNELESEANLFASNFLLPEEEFIDDLKKVSHKSNPDSFISLKVKYNVSIQALEMRAFKLGLITPRQNSYFYRQIFTKGYKEAEPLDGEIVFVRPGKIRSIMDVVFRNNLLFVNEFLDELGVELDYFCSLFSIEQEFFKKYLEKESYAHYDNIYPINHSVVR